MQIESCDSEAESAPNTQNPAEDQTPTEALPNTQRHARQRHQQAPLRPQVHGLHRYWLRTAVRECPEL
jgi:hypothetical protein